MWPRILLLAPVLPILLAGEPAAGGGTVEEDPPVRLDGSVRVELSMHLGTANADTVPQEAGRPAGDPEEGLRLFNQLGCNGCHMVDEVGGMVGPDLTEVGARPSRDPDRWPTTEEYIRSSIEQPGIYIVSGYTDMMPPPENLGLDEEMIEHLVEYLITLRGDDKED